MDIKPIDINIKDNWKFTQVAFLVDQPNFLADIDYERKKLKVPAHLISRDEVDTWSEEADNLETFSKDESVVKTKLLHRYPLIEQFILKLLSRYEKTTQFHHVVRHALLTGVVSDEDLPMDSVHLKMIDQEEYAYMYISGIYLPTEMALILTPETRLNDVIKAYKKHFRNFSQSYQNHILQKYGTKPVKTKRNNQDARKWYWLHKQGEGYASIARREIMENKPTLDHENLQAHIRERSSGIRKAILRYANSLKLASLSIKADN